MLMNLLILILIGVIASSGSKGISVNRLVHLSILPSAQNFVPDQGCHEIHAVAMAPKE